MAVTHYTLTAKFADLLGTAFSTTHAKVVVWIETNVGASEGVVDDVSDIINLGPQRTSADAAGVATFANLIGSDSDPGDIGLAEGTLQYRVTAEYINAITRKRGERWSSGWFSLTANTNLADVVAEQYIPATYLSQATAALDAHAAELEVELDGLVTDAEAAKTGAQDARDLAEQYRDEAHDISNISTSDGVVEALINDTGSDTSAALSASYARPTSIVLASGGDDSTALQAALNGGGWVHCPDPLYLVGSKVKINVAGTKLTGSGWEGATVFQLTAAGACFQVSQPRCVLDGFDIDGNATATNGLILHNANRAVVGAIDVKDCVSHGIVLDIAADTPTGNNNIAEFRSTRSQNNGGHGWAVPTRQSDNNGILWHGCEANGNDGAGVLYKGSGAKCVSGIFQNNRQYGWALGEAGDASTTTAVKLIYPWLEANGAFLGGAMTSGTATLTTTTSGWSAIHVGATVNVPGAGVAGATLTALVSAYVSPTSVTLDTTASTTVTNKSISCPNNGVYGSLKSVACILDAPAGQQSVVSADTGGRVVQLYASNNGEYSVVGASGRGIQFYGRSGATTRVEVIPVATETDAKLSLLGKGAGGVQVEASGGKVGFFGTAPTTKATVTGTRADAAALASLLTELAAKGLITDSSTAGTPSGGTTILTAYKTSSTTYNANATLADDPELFVTVAASGIYIVESYIPYSASTAGDAQLKWSAPAGASMNWAARCLASNASTTGSATGRAQLNLAQAATLGGVGVGTGTEAGPVGLLTIGVTGGTFKAQTAQATSDATDTVFNAGGWIKLTKVN